MKKDLFLEQLELGSTCNTVFNSIMLLNSEE